MDFHFGIDSFYLPIDTLFKKPIAIFLLDGSEDEDQIGLMAQTIIQGLCTSGFYPETRQHNKFCFEATDTLLVIYKKVPMLDIFQHLEGN